MIIKVYRTGRVRIIHPAADRRRATVLLGQVLPYREWQRITHPNNSARHMRKVIVHELRKIAEGKV